MNQTKVSRLLSIGNVEGSDMYDVIGRMKVLLEFFKRQKRYKNLTPFLKTYHLITKSVAERSLEDNNFFKNPMALNHLDVHFANLYFRPLKYYLVNNRMVRPWQTYFRYCERADGIPFLQMLLGINAHINSDLLTSVIMLQYQYKSDFLKINKILKDEIPDVMKFLAFVDHDLYGYGALVFRKFVLHEFKNVIVAWRNQVWQNALLSHARSFSDIQKRVHAQTEALADELIGLFHSGKFSNFSQVVTRVNKLRVKV